MTQCFPLLVIGYPVNYRDFLFFDKICSVICCRIVVWGKALTFEYNCLMHGGYYHFFVSLNVLTLSPHLDTFWRLCSRRRFEKIVTKEEIAQNEPFLLMPQCFPLLIIGYPFNYSDFLLFDKIWSKSSAAELSYEEKG